MMQGTSFLVNIEGYCVTSEHMTIVMEYMHKGSLFDCIHKVANVPWSMLQKVFNHDPFRFLTILFFAIFLPFSSLFY